MPRMAIESVSKRTKKIRCIDLFVVSILLLHNFILFDWASDIVCRAERICLVVIMSSRASKEENGGERGGGYEAMKV